MQDSNTYRHYANDCRRIAETMSAKDKAIMLEMAKVWDERAERSRTASSEPSSEQGRPRLEVGQPSVAIHHCEDCKDLFLRNLCKQE